MGADRKAIGEVIGEASAQVDALDQVHEVDPLDQVDALERLTRWRHDPRPRGKGGRKDASKVPTIDTKGGQWVRSKEGKGWVLEVTEVDRRRRLLWRLQGNHLA